jgi:hypothetical protein
MSPYNGRRTVAQARDVEWCRRLGDRLASRQLKRSRTVSITFQRRGITSSVSVMSSPSLDSLAGASLRRGDDDPLLREMIGERATRRPPALERSDRLRRRLLRGQFVLARRRLEFFQL